MDEVEGEDRSGTKNCPKNETVPRPT